MAITHRFEDSRDTYGQGYFACIEDGQLVIAEDWPREGGVTYQGTYADAGSRLEQLKTEDECLYYSIQESITEVLNLVMYQMKLERFVKVFKHAYCRQY